MTLINPKRLDKFKSKEYRHSYLREMTTGWIVHQVKELRTQREWSQAQLGKEMGKPQSAIARIENLDYGKWNTSTLLELAEAFDVAIEVRFVDWPTFLKSTDDTSPDIMRVPSFSLDGFIPIPSDIAGTNEIKIEIEDNNVIDFNSARRNDVTLDVNDRRRLPPSGTAPTNIKLRSIEKSEMANEQY